MTKQKIVTGILVGAAAGAVIAYLFATEDGAAIRKKLGEKGGVLSDLFKSKIGEWSDVVKDELGNIVNTAGNAADKTMEQGRNMAQAQADKWQS